MVEMALGDRDADRERDTPVQAVNGTPKDAPSDRAKITALVNTLCPDFAIVCKVLLQDKNLRWNTAVARLREEELDLKSHGLGQGTAFYTGRRGSRTSNQSRGSNTGRNHRPRKGNCFNMAERVTGQTPVILRRIRVSNECVPVYFSVVGTPLEKGPKEDEDTATVTANAGLRKRV
ncbi:MAG: hypothetical protein M1816_007626 [Peltula sp. TS41687]|nr:MAG: hypothetical protein M1816_007626 [Peltula sp. TS41687]